MVKAMSSARCNKAYPVFKLLLEKYDIPSEDIMSMVGENIYWHENESILNLFLDWSATVKNGVIIYPTVFRLACIHGFTQILKRVLSKREIIFHASTCFLRANKVDVLKILLNHSNVSFPEHMYDMLWKFNDMELIRIALERLDAPVKQLLEHAFDYDKEEIIFHILEKRNYDSMSTLRVCNHASPEIFGRVVEYLSKKESSVMKDIRLDDCFNNCCYQENIPFLEFILKDGTIFGKWPPPILIRDILPALQQSGKTKSVECITRFLASQKKSYNK